MKKHLLVRHWSRWVALGLWLLVAVIPAVFMGLVFLLLGVGWERRLNTTAMLLMMYAAWMTASVWSMLVCPVLDLARTRQATAHRWGLPLSVSWFGFWLIGGAPTLLLGIVHAHDLHQYEENLTWNGITLFIAASTLLVLSCATVGLIAEAWTRSHNPGPDCV